MREAIRSLRLVRALRNDAAIVPEQTGQRQRFFKEAFGTVLVEQDFTVQKTGQSISEYNRATTHYSSAPARRLRVPWGSPVDVGEVRPEGRSWCSAGRQ